MFLLFFAFFQPPIFRHFWDVIGAHSQAFITQFFWVWSSNVAGSIDVVQVANNNKCPFIHMYMIAGFQQEATRGANLITNLSRGAAVLYP